MGPDLTAPDFAYGCSELSAMPFGHSEVTYSIILTTKFKDKAHCSSQKESLMLYFKRIFISVSEALSAIV